MSQAAESLTHLGWSAFFADQLTESEVLEDVVRIVSVRRTMLQVQRGKEVFAIPFQHSLMEKLHPAVGDWLVLDKTQTVIERILERKTELQRLPSNRGRQQVKVEPETIMANSDGAFIVSSCNDDFNESRLERFLVLCHSAGVDPVLVITKIDLCEDVDRFHQRIGSLGGNVPSHFINVLEADQAKGLHRYFHPDRTITLLGSSGVGKSTLINLLSGQQQQRTGSVRDYDQRGRHVTTERKLIPLPGGGLIVDMPGVRAVGVAPSMAGIQRTFPDIFELASECKFHNCQHGPEPECKVKEAILSKRLSKRRLLSYFKVIESTML